MLSENQGNDSDDDEVQVIEEPRKPLTADDDLDTIHTVRSKLFYKKEETWTELGVGDLKLVNVDGQGTQVGQWMDRQTDGRTDGWTDRQTRRQTHDRHFQYQRTCLCFRY